MLKFPRALAVNIGKERCFRSTVFMWPWTDKFVAKCILQITLNTLTKHFWPVDRIKKSYKSVNLTSTTDSARLRWKLFNLNPTLYISIGEDTVQCPVCQ